MDEKTLRLDRRQFAKLAGAGGLTGLAGCMQDPGEDDNGDGVDDAGRNGEGDDAYDHVVIAQVEEPATMNPYYPGLTRTHLNLHLHLYDHLVRRDPDNDYDPVPGLAEDWEQIDDETWQFTLRDDAEFHNGDTLTADHVSRSFDLMQDEDYSPGLAEQMGLETEVDVIDDYELEFYVPQLDISATFLERLTTYSLVVHPDDFDEKDDDQIDDEGVYGTGPFELQEWDRGSSITLERNENWWNGTPKIETITWEFISEDSTRMNALQTGDLDIAANLPTSYAAEVDEDPDLEITEEPSVRVAWCVFNQDDTPFESREVRQAANYAVDVEEILAEVREGYGEVMGQPIPDYFFGYNPDVEPYPYDPEEAERLLDDAGYSDGFEITFTVDTSFEAEAQAISGYLSEVGIDTSVEVGDEGTLTTDYVEGEMEDLYYFDWGNWSLFHGAGTYQDNFYSEGEWSYVNNEEADSLLEETFATADLDELEALYQELGEVTHEHAECLFLFTYVDLHGKIPELEEFRANSTDLIYLDFVE